MAKTLLVAKYAGFCMGVRRAVETAMQAAEARGESRELFAYGELIHNESVNRRLASRGVQVIDSLDAIERGEVIIRSHGVSKAVYEQAQAQGLTVIDTTCVFVKRVHDIVNTYDRQGYQVVIAGSAKHPEVIGISGWCHRAIVVSTCEEAQAIQANKPICLVAQTTLNTEVYRDIVSCLQARFDDVVVFQTICSATKNRQQEVREMAQRADFMIVIGGKNSSNTKKLYEIAKKICGHAQLIQDFTQIEVNLLRNYGTIGIVAGASTPDWIIDEVIQKLNFEGEVVFNGK